MLAGLLRPEGWVFAAAYGLWLWRGADARGRARIVALVALAPLLWALSDLVATGDPLFSWTYTTGEAGRLGRQRTWDEAPRALWSALRELLKPPLALVGFAGVALVRGRRSLERWRGGGRPARRPGARRRRRSGSSCSAACRARCRATR